MRNPVEVRDQPIALKSHLPGNFSKTSLVRFAEAAAAQPACQNDDCQENDYEGLVAEKPTNQADLFTWVAQEYSICENVRRENHHIPSRSTSGRQRKTHTP